MLLLFLACEPVAIDPGEGLDTHDSAPLDEVWGASVYEPMRVLEVDVELDAEEWEDLRNQKRNFLDLLSGEDCLSEPWVSPYTWFDADVTIDGEAFTGEARKKGLLGSVEPGRPSLKLKLTNDFEGVDRFTLNNGRQDASRFKTCMGYEILGRAGVAAPRCSLAHVTVNGEDLGLYSNVEPIKPPLLARHFGGDGQNDLFEGTLSDFRPGWVTSFQDKTGDSDRAPLERLTEVLQLEDDQAFLEQLEQVVHVENFLEYWAMEVLLGHWDSYAGNTNNFWVYVDDDGLLNFIPWGIDAILVGDYPFGEFRPTSVIAVGALSNRLYGIDSTRAAYHDTLQRLMDEAWDEDALQEHFSDLRDVGREYAWPQGKPETYFDVVDLMEDFIATRQATVEAEIATNPDWTEATRASPCIQDLGNVDITFATTWGSYGTLPTWSTGSGSFEVNVGGEPVAVAHLTTLVGEYDTGQSVFLLGGTLDDGSHIAVYLVGPSEAYAQPGEVGADWSDLSAYLLVNPNGDLQNWQQQAWLGGTLVLDQSSTIPGQPVTGSAQFTIWGASP